nr:hypothetical protein CFP56_02953 [Quercus suber]
MFDVYAVYWNALAVQGLGGAQSVASSIAIWCDLTAVHRPRASCCAHGRRAGKQADQATTAQIEHVPARATRVRPGALAAKGKNLVTSHDDMQRQRRANRGPFARSGGPNHSTVKTLPIRTVPKGPLRSCHPPPIIIPILLPSADTLFLQGASTSSTLGRAVESLVTARQTLMGHGCLRAAAPVVLGHAPPRCRPPTSPSSVDLLVGMQGHRRPDTGCATGNAVSRQAHDPPTVMPSTREGEGARRMARGALFKDPFPPCFVADDLLRIVALEASVRSE